MNKILFFVAIASMMSLTAFGSSPEFQWKGIFEIKTPYLSVRTVDLLED